MKKNLLTLSCLFFVLAGTAQPDSSHLDLGWLVLDRGLTQTVTIKGSDLEKMPFVNLSDAIAAWVYGAYTRPVSLAYVVDGNPVTDVNIYPIFDIEEVTLVEQAAGAAAYGNTQQSLVVITTRRGKGKQGVRAAGQAGLVNDNGDGYNTYTRVYHQYYVGAYRNETKVSYGVSADWIRDVAPEPNDGQVHVSVPFQLQRWRLNGWMEWRPAKGQVVELRVGYAPQIVKGMLDSSDGYFATNVRLQASAHLVIPQLRWQAALWPGGTNELRAIYLDAAGNYSFSGMRNSLTGGQSYPLGELSVTGGKQVFLRDRIGYVKRAGDWMVAPAVDISYHHIEEQDAIGSALVYTGGSGQLIVYPAVLGPTAEQKGNLFFVTPVLELGWRKALNIQIGERVNASSEVGAVVDRSFPFASLGADLLHLESNPDGMSLKVFGSYAQRSTELVDDYSLLDFSGGGGNRSLEDVYQSPEVPAGLGFGANYQNDTFLVRVTTPRVYWVWDAGVCWSTAGGRLSVQYTYEQRIFSSAGQFGSVGPTPDNSFIVVPSWKSTLHHLDVRWKAVEEKDMHWLMGFNFTLLKDMRYPVAPPSGMFGSSFYAYQSGSPLGDAPDSRFSWTGGLVNRWQLGNFTAGLDLLYHFGEGPPPSIISIYQSTGTKLNSVLVPNIYAGYRWKVGAGMLELFVESRGLARSQQSDLPDDRRYYTLGGSYNL